MRKSTSAYVNVILSSVYGKIPQKKKRLKYFMGINVGHLVKCGVLLYSLFLGAFAKLQKVTCPSVCPYGSTRLPLYGHRPATSWVYYTTICNTQYSAPEDGQNNCPKLVELTGIINKPLLLHLVGCLYYLYE